MANTQKIAGLDSYLLYKTEDVYGSAETTASKWSYIQSFTPTIKNNMINITGYAGSAGDPRAVHNMLPGQLDISWNMDLIPNDFSFMKYALGSTSESGSTNTYTASTAPLSFTMTNNIDNDTTDRQEVYSGCVVNSMTLKAAVGESVSVNLAGMSNLITTGTSLTANAANATDTIWTFQHGSLNIDGAISNIIDSVELTVTNNWEMKYGLGSRLCKKAIGKVREITLRFTVKYLDNTLHTKLLGATPPTAAGSPTSVTSAVLKFTKLGKSVTITVRNGYIEEFSGTHNLNELIGEDFTLIGKSIDIVWDNQS